MKFNSTALIPDHSGTHGTPRSRTDVLPVASLTGESALMFPVPSRCVTTQRGEVCICTTCGNVVSGAHPASCNSPTQRFVTPEEWARIRPKNFPRGHVIDAEEFRRRREQARKNADPAEVEML